MKNKKCIFLSILAVLVIVITGFGSITLYAEDDNQVYSQNFDALDGSNNNFGWTNFGDGSSVSVVTTEHCFSGSKALKLSNHINSWNSPCFDIYDILSQHGAGTYTVNLWIYVEGLNSVTTPARLLLRGDYSSRNISFMEEHNGNYYKGIGTKTTLLVGKADYLTGSFVITENDLKDSAKTLNLCIDSITGAADSNIYIDSVQIYKLSDFSIYNGDFDLGIAGWRSWGGNGYIYNQNGSEPGYGNTMYYNQVDLYSSLACNVNQILDYFGTNKFTIEFDIKVNALDNAVKGMRFYLTKNQDQYHYNIGENKRTYYLGEDWQHIKLTFDTSIVPEGKTQTLYQLLSPAENEVHFRMQRSEDEQSFSYWVDNVILTCNNHFDTRHQDYGTRYVSSVEKHQVNGQLIPMKGESGGYPLNRIDYLCAVYESGDLSGSVSNNSGDPGGTSYGVYQFTANSGTAQRFVNWLGQNGYTTFYALLQGKTPGYSNFDTAWEDCADVGSAFKNAQFEYAKEAFYDPLISNIQSYCNQGSYNYNIALRSNALQNVLFAMSIKFGASTAYSLFKDAVNGKYLPSLTDVEVIALLTERITRTYPSGYLGKTKCMNSNISISYTQNNQSQTINISVDKLGVRNQWLAQHDSSDARTQLSVLVRHYGIYFDALQMYALEVNT